MKLFLHKYLAHHMYKPILIGEELKKNSKLGFLGPEVLLFCLKCPVDW